MAVKGFPPSVPTAGIAAGGTQQGGSWCDQVRAHYTRAFQGNSISSLPQLGKFRWQPESHATRKARQEAFAATLLVPDPVREKIADLLDFADRFVVFRVDVGGEPTYAVRRSWLDTTEEHQLMIIDKEGRCAGDAQFLGSSAEGFRWRSKDEIAKAELVKDDYFRPDFTA